MKKFAFIAALFALATVGYAFDEPSITPIDVTNHGTESVIQDDVDKVMQDIPAVDQSVPAVDKDDQFLNNE